MPQAANLVSLSINDLCFGKDDKQYLFNIPTYQRGYRWNEHVIKLLDDLLDYSKARESKKNVGDYYCLQPIIMKRYDRLDSVDEICYEVVDGQQRLTTIYILLQVFDFKNQCFHISFERDGDDKVREEFLANIGREDGGDDSKADYFYMRNAYKKAKDWLVAKNKELRRVDLETDMRQVLLKYTRVIWYELSEKISGREVFRNINSGKLPLTDSELIKAMMLNSKHYAPKGAEVETRERFIRIEQERKARLWDDIERTLQDTQFWAFISGGTEYSTRIDYIFKCIYDEDSSEIKKNSNSLFDYFEKRISEEKDEDALSRIEEIWNEVRLYFRTFQDWYSNKELYNYIGYVIKYRIVNILLIKNEFRARTKDDFLKWLQETIKKHLKISDTAKGVQNDAV